MILRRCPPLKVDGGDKKMRLVVELLERRVFCVPLSDVAVVETNNCLHSGVVTLPKVRRVERDSFLLVFVLALKSLGKVNPRAITFACG
eukprot:COSAG05_NODE_5193_length_1240_cov_72.967572_2_plen_89_part_00